MKLTSETFWLASMAGFLTILPASLLASDTNSLTGGAPSDAPAPAPVISATPSVVATKLPYGAEDVLKLSQANIGEEIILNYVQSSGTIYNLSPKDIVYLHNQGVSEKVINAMIDQRKRVELAAQAAAPGMPQQSAQLTASAN